MKIKNSVAVLAVALTAVFAFECAAQNRVRVQPGQRDPNYIYATTSLEGRCDEEDLNVEQLLENAMRLIYKRLPRSIGGSGEIVTYDQRGRGGVNHHDTEQLERFDYDYLNYTLDTFEVVPDADGNDYTVTPLDNNCSWARYTMTIRVKDPRLASDQQRERYNRNLNNEEGSNLRLREVRDRIRRDR